MGNSVSRCEEERGVRVQEALTGESTQLRGSDASNDARSPAETAPAVPMTPGDAESEKAAGGLLERAKETVVSAKDAAESALHTAMEHGRASRTEEAGEVEEGAGAGAGAAAQEEEEEEGGAGAAEGMKTVTLRTAPNDPRFPVSNQTRHCYVAYNEYYKCIRDRGEENQECKFIKKNYRSICPDEWIERWEELRQEGSWYGKY